MINPFSPTGPITNNLHTKKWPNTYRFPTEKSIIVFHEICLFSKIIALEFPLQCYFCDIIDD